MVAAYDPIQHPAWTGSTSYKPQLSAHCIGKRHTETADEIGPNELRLATPPVWLTRCRTEVFFSRGKKISLPSPETWYWGFTAKPNWAGSLYDDIKGQKVFNAKVWS